MLFNHQDRKYTTVLLHISYVLQYVLKNFQGLETKPSVSVAYQRLPELASFLSSQSSWALVLS